MKLSGWQLVAVLCVLLLVIAGLAYEGILSATEAGLSVATIIGWLAPSPVAAKAPVAPLVGVLCLSLLVPASASVEACRPPNSGDVGNLCTLVEAYVNTPLVQAICVTAGELLDLIDAAIASKGDMNAPCRVIGNACLTENQISVGINAVLAKRAAAEKAEAGADAMGSRK